MVEDARHCVVEVGKLTGRHRFDDGRAYDVGLSDDAGAANNLGLAASQALLPICSSRYPYAA